MISEFWLELAIAVTNVVKAIMLGAAVGLVFALLSPLLLGIVFPGVLVVNGTTRLYTSSYPMAHGIFVLVGFCIGALSALAATFKGAPSHSQTP